VSLAHPADRAHHIDIATGLRDGADVTALVQEMARAHRISFADGPLDAFARTASRLSDAKGWTQTTEDLLVALARAGVITSAESMVLQAAHLRQTAG